MNSKQAGRPRTAAANAIMHADVRVFSLLPRDLKRDAPHRTYRPIILHVLAKIVFYWPTIKYARHSTGAIKRRLTVHNGRCVNTETQISRRDKGDRSDCSEEVTAEFTNEFPFDDYFGIGRSEYIEFLGMLEGNGLRV